MKERISQKLRQIESEHAVEVLFACESGSRAWGFASPDSDYDIRFIYKRPATHYLSLWEKRDTIEFKTTDELDGAGWDIDKTLTLLSKSNGGLIEWLFSPIVYHEAQPFIDELRDIAKRVFSPISTIHHYLGTTKNFLTVCQDESIKLKQYFYALRTVLAAKWIADKETIPPVAFDELLMTAPNDIQDSIRELIYIKSQKNESYRHPNQPLITEYIISTMNKNQQQASSLHSGNKIAEELDVFFRKTILNKS